MNSYDLAAWLDEYSFLHDSEKAIFNVISKKLRYQTDKIADLQTTIRFLEEECKAMRKQANEL